MPESRYFCVAKGDYPELACGEAISLFKTYGANDIRTDGCIVICQGDINSEMISRRIALSRFFAIELNNNNIYFLAGRTFCCVGNSDFNITTKVAEYIKEKTGATVCLENPDYEIVIYKFESEKQQSHLQDSYSCFFNQHFTAGIRYTQNKVDWHSRLVGRKYIHPSSLDPRLARTMVNLACVRGGQRILDPFCGTGGILIEALEFSINVTGIDIDGQMCKWAKSNTVHRGGDFEIIRSDALRMPLVPFCMDAIVTDIPYGKSTLIGGRKSAVELLKDFISIACDNVRRLVIMCNRIDEKVILETHSKMEIDSIYHIYEHKSLTRSLVTINIW